MQRLRLYKVSTTHKSRGFNKVENILTTSAIKAKKLSELAKKHPVKVVLWEKFPVLNITKFFDDTDYVIEVSCKETNTDFQVDIVEDKLDYEIVQNGYGGLLKGVKIKYEVAK